MPILICFIIVVIVVGAIVGGGVVSLRLAESRANSSVRVESKFMTVLRRTIMPHATLHIGHHTPKDYDDNYNRYVVRVRADC